MLVTPVTWAGSPTLSLSANPASATSDVQVVPSGVTSMVLEAASSGGGFEGAFRLEWSLTGSTVWTVSYVAAGSADSSLHALYVPPGNAGRVLSIPVLGARVRVLAERYVGAATLTVKLGYR